MAMAPRTLGGQLMLLFLVLTLLPSLTLTALATHRLLASLERWENPGVQSALEGSIEVARDLLTRTRNDLRQRGQLLVADPALGPPADPAALRARLASAYNIDFVQLYNTEGVLQLEVTRDPLIAPVGTLSSVVRLAASDQPFLEEATRGLLAYAGVAGEPGRSDAILVAGIYLEPEFYARLDRLSQGVAYYRQLAVLKRVNRSALMLTVAFTVAFLGLGSAWTARRLAVRVSRPVANLADAMERVALGEEGVRVGPEGSREVERLIQTFNAMSAELSRSRRDLASAERLTAWQEVARRVAHEMKNALTPVTFSLHRLRKLTPDLPETERDRARRALDTLGGEVEGLQRLAASFSELARLPMVEAARVDLREVVAGAVEGLTGTVCIHWSPPTDPAWSRADRTLLRQALGNILKNATEAAGENGQVWIALDEASGRMRITVDDDGPGWPPGARETALEPYFTTKEQGTGLGLSLVQRTMLQHGGSMELQDRPGGGARVVLSLPAAGGGSNPKDAGRRPEAS